jgi:hypothetical protein
MRSFMHMITARRCSAVPPLQTSKTLPTPPPVNVVGATTTNHAATVVTMAIDVMIADMSAAMTEDRQPRQGRGGGRAPPGGGVGVGMVDVAPLPGSMSLVRSATRKDMPPKIVGGDSKMMMMTPMTRKPMLLHMESI